MKTEAREKEACSLVLGDTLKKDFPLILVMGREPNNHSEVVNKLGHYNSPNGSNFWMFSHGLIARYTDLDARKFKNACRTQNSSPIVFCDASPLGMDKRYSPAKKKKLRKAIDATNLEAHAKTVFSQSTIVSRTTLVLISGIEGCGLEHALPFIKQQCDSHKIPYVHIASLSAMTKKHTHKNRMHQIGPSGKAIIQACTDQFLYGPIQKAA